MSDLEKEFSPPYENEDGDELSDLSQNGFLQGIASPVSLGSQVLHENEGVLLEQGLDWKEVAEEAFEESEGDTEPIIDKGEMIEQDDDLITSPNSSNFSFDESAEIEGISNFNIVLEYPELNYEVSDVFEFEGEINDWFGAQDLKDMKMMSQIYQLSVKPIGEEYLDFNSLSTPQKISLMVSLSENAIADDINTRLKSLISLCYIVMGGFDNIIDHDLHLQTIFQNARLFLEPAGIGEQNDLILDNVIKVLKSSMTELSNIKSFYKQSSQPTLLKKLSNILFYTMTILYICVIVIIEPKEQDSLSLDEEKEKLQSVVDRNELLVHITQSIDSWRWLANETEEKEINQSNQATGITKLPTNKNAQLFRFRNVVLLLWKLFVVQFGDTKKRDSTKSFLKFRYEDQNKFSNRGADLDDASRKNTNIISPTDYHHFRNGLIARYPSYTPPKYEISHVAEMILEESEDEKVGDELGAPGVFTSSSTRRLSSSSSSLLLNQQHSFKQKPPFNDKPPEIHIATPVPSPTLAPQHTGNSSNHMSKVSEVDNMNAKGRKVFMTHPSYPHIYPISLDDSKTDIEVPCSIKEAATLFYEHVREDFNTKQFLSVFEQFIKDENGMNLLPEEDPGEEFKYKDSDLKANPLFTDEIKSLQRVEDYYEKCLPHFNSLVVVLLQILASNLFNNNSNELLRQASNGGSPSASDFRMKKDYRRLSEFERQKLDLIRMKETSLKGASSILFVLLKWFKLSHFLKFEYFASLIFDNDFYIHLFGFLGSNQMNTQLGDSLDYDDPQNLMINRMVFCDYEILYDHAEYSFFKKALSLSKNENKSSYTTNFSDVASVIDEKQTTQQYNLYAPPFVGQTRLTVTKPNWRYCLILNNLFRTLYMTISKTKSQRIYRLLETRPTESLRFYLTLYNESLYKPILKIVKAISPFNGKKWRSNNMDLISFVYLFYNVGLKDHWLTNFFTVNLNERLKKSWDHEYALRSLLLFYNVRNYGEEMAKLGHHERIGDTNSDYFSDELQKLIGEEIIEQQQQQQQQL